MVFISWLSNYLVSWFVIIFFTRYISYGGSSIFYAKNI